MDIGVLVAAWNAIKPVDPATNSMVGQVNAGIITAPTHGVCFSREAQATNP